MPRKPVAVVVAIVAAFLGPAAALAAAPGNTVPPSISGSAREGQTLTRETGSWSGTAPITFTQRWQRCDATGGECVNLPATGPGYALVAADVGSTMRVVVTATNADGIATATSPATAVVTGTPPQNTTAPSVTGNPRQGQVLSAVRGTWTGTTPLTYAYEWRSCDATGSACDAIAGETGTTYQLAAADLGRTVRVKVTATNPAGTEVATSPATTPIGPPDPPAATGAPIISGTARDGSTLSSTTGTWSGAAPITYARRWQRCDALGQGCLDTPVTNATYLAGPQDIGRTVRVVVTASNPDGSSTATSDPSPVVETNPPSSTAPPSVTGATRVGQTLSATNGTWGGTQPLGFSRQWQRCDPGGTSCVPIAGESGSTYALGNEDRDHTIRHVVTASNEGGTASATSGATPLVGPAQPPVNSALPTISGVTADGQTLSSSTGTWTGAAPLSYVRSWQRCDAQGAGCTDLGVAAGVYKVQSADVGSRLRMVVVASNPDGTATATSDLTAVVTAVAPRSTAVPSISGTARDTQTLTATTGSWSGTTPMEHAVRWLRCDGGGANCVPVPGATTTSRTLGPEDIGTTTRVEVTATNSGGTATATSNPTAVIQAAAPSNSVLPSVSGTTRDGQRLTADPGTWTGTTPISHGYQWRRCSSAGSGCKDVTGATARTYDLSPADVGSTLSVRVVGSNVAGNATVFSASSAVIAADPPRATAPPVVTGDAVDGATLSASPGTWTGTPAIALAYRWERCDELAGCRAIAGATGQTHTLSSADVGAEVRVVVTGTNSGGSATAESARTAPVAAIAPVATQAPALTGTARDAETLTATPGTWSGTVPIAHAYQWRSCDARGLSCTDLPGETATTYTLRSADVGRTVRVAVTGSNAAGSATAASTQTSVVTPRPPSNVVVPVVTGLARDGRVLTVEPGEWQGTPPLERRYAWKRCDASGGRCADIVTAGGQTYTLTTADVGSTVRAVVTVTNGGGTAAVTTAQTGVVQPSPPVNQAIPELSGEVVEGSLVSVSDGTWTGLVPMTFEHRWWRCDASGENCSPIAGVTERDYRVTGIEVGLSLRAEVIATNAGGSTSAFSDASPVGEPAPPANVTAPGVAGHHGVGQELEAVRGGWTGSPVMRFTYQWQACDDAGEGCEDVPGATADAVRLGEPDVGRTFRVRVTATNGAGSATAVSAVSAVVRDDPPVNETLPSVTGDVVAETLELGSTLGTWSGATPMAPSHQWRRCDLAGAACEDITGATDARYTPQAADVGRTLRVVVTMDNGVGATPATSEATTPVGQAPPRATQPPTATAPSVREGQSAKGTQGTWAGAPPLAYGLQWLRCDAAGERCVVIPDATSLKYTFAAADVGSTIRLRVTAANGTGSRSAESLPLGPVLGLPPAVGTKPRITGEGKPRAGAPLRVEAGAWTGTAPIAFAYRWQRCVSSTDCADLPGATGAEYVPVDDDIGKRLRVVVAATNGTGTGTAETPVTDLVGGRPPAAQSGPEVDGTPVDGRRLKARLGSWAGTAPVEYAYQWERCLGKTCKLIAGATSATHDISSEDVGYGVRVKVLATNPFGRSEATSASTEPVVAVAPFNKRRPSISRLPTVLEPGLVLKGRDGRWKGSAPLDLTRQWVRCNRAGQRCRLIRGATGEAYTLTAKDLRRGKLRRAIRFAVTATNPSGDLTVLSKPVGRTAKPQPERVAFAAVAFADGRLGIAIACQSGRAPCAGTVRAGGGSAEVSAPAGSSSLAIVEVTKRVGAWTRVRFEPGDRASGLPVSERLRVTRPAAAAALRRR